MKYTIQFLTNSGDLQTKGKVTTGALLMAIDSWHRYLEVGLNISFCAVFFDLKKAFDSISHTVLLNKSSESGLC